MFIDIHSHAFKRPLPNLNQQRWFSTAEEILERHKELNIERSVLLPLLGPEVHIGQTNDEVLEIVAKSDGHFIPFCNIDPRALTNSSDAPLGYLFEHYMKLGCKGVGEVTANLPIRDQRVQNLFKFCEEFEMPLTFHIAAQIGGMYGLYDEPGLPQLEAALQKYANLKFLGHSQTFWAEICVLKNPTDRYGYPEYEIVQEGVVPKLFRRYDNLYGDLSARSAYNALQRDRKYGIGFINEFQNRLFFGTDICEPDTPTPLVDYLIYLKNNGEISETVFNKIARENAIKILKL